MHILLASTVEDGDKIVDWVMKLGLPTVIILLLILAGVKFVRWFRPHADAVIEAHRNFLTKTAEASVECNKQQQVTNLTLAQQTDLLEGSQKMLEKIADAVVRRQRKV